MCRRRCDDTAWRISATGRLRVCYFGRQHECCLDFAAARIACTTCGGRFNRVVAQMVTAKAELVISKRHSTTTPVALGVDDHRSFSPVRGSGSARSFQRTERILGWTNRQLGIMVTLQVEGVPGTVDSL